MVSLCDHGTTFAGAGYEVIVSCYVEAANKDQFMAIKEDLFQVRIRNRPCPRLPCPIQPGISSPPLRLEKTPGNDVACAT